MDDSLHARGRALEDQFFREKDRQLIEKLRAELSEKKSHDALAAATGITNAEVLDALLKNKVTAESLTSVSLIPLIAVAWADGSLDDEERVAILKAAEAAGVASGYELVSFWLNKKPSSELLNSWKDYIRALKASLDATAFGQVKASVMDRAQRVADAAGGFLGMRKTSAAESNVLNEIEDAFR